MKKQSERTILEGALERARTKGGEARRNVDRLKGNAMGFEEPDFLIRMVDGRIIGIEHFRIDHFVRHDKKVQSEAAKFNSNCEKARKRMIEAGAPDCLDNAILTEVGNMINQAFCLSKNATLNDISHSLDARLFGENGHVQKIDTYRSHLEDIEPNKDTDLGFLIEMHSDLRGLFFNTSHGARKLCYGELPLSQEIYDLLLKASSSIDWMIIAFCGSITNEVTDAAVIRCSKGRFATSARRQGLIPVSYLGIRKNPLTQERVKEGNVKLARDNGTVTYLVENTSPPPDPIELWKRAIRGGAQALSADTAVSPFVATLPVQMLYEILRDRALGRHRPISVSTVWKMLQSMGADELALGAECFAAKWGIHD